MYVVYWCENLKDGETDGAKIVRDKKEALELLDQLANGFNGRSLDLRLFELGKAVTIEKDYVEAKPEPKPKEYKYRILD